MLNMNSISLKTKELLRFQSGCHDNKIFIVTRYVGHVLSQETSIPNMNSIQLKTKKVLRSYSGCHGI